MGACHSTTARYAVVVVQGRLMRRASWIGLQEWQSLQQDFLSCLPGESAKGRHCDCALSFAVLAVTTCTIYAYCGQADVQSGCLCWCHVLCSLRRSKGACKSSTWYESDWACILESEIFCILLGKQQDMAPCKHDHCSLRAQKWYF